MLTKFFKRFIKQCNHLLLYINICCVIFQTVQAVSFEKKKLMLKTKLPLRPNTILFMQNAITNIRT